MTEPLDALLSFAHAVHHEAQVRFQLSEEEGQVCVVVVVGTGPGAAEIVRTQPGTSKQAIAAAIDKLRGISTRISFGKVQQLIAEAQQKK